LSYPDKSPERDQYDPEETQRRMESAIRRALNTPPKPHSEMVGKGKRAKRLGKESSQKVSRRKS